MFLFIGIKAKLHKNICKRNIFFAKRVFLFVPVLKKCIFFQNIQAEAFFFVKKTILKIKVTAFRAQKAFFFFLKGKKAGVSVFCASKQVKSLEPDRKSVFCGYRNSNKQISRKKTLLKAWIRQECCVKPLTNEFKGLMHLNSCLFKFSRSDIYINLKETDVSIIFVSRETLFSWSAWTLLLFHVKQKGGNSR